MWLGSSGPELSPALPDKTFPLIYTNVTLKDHSRGVHILEGNLFSL